MKPPREERDSGVLVVLEGRRSFRGKLHKPNTVSHHSLETLLKRKNKNKDKRYKASVTNYTSTNGHSFNYT